MERENKFHSMSSDLNMCAVTCMPMPQKINKRDQIKALRGIRSIGSGGYTRVRANDHGWVDGTG